MPSSFARVVIGVDPSLSARGDAHGIVVAGLGHDGQIYIIENHTAKLDPHEAAAIVVDRALALGVSLVLAEKNRGGQYIRDTVRLTAQARGVAFSEILDERPPAFRKGVVQLRCFMSTEKKIERAQVASVLVQQGLVSLVPGKLGDLEERMICFAGDGSDAGGDDAVDAAVTAILELGAGMKPLDRAGEIGACVTMNKQLVAAHRPETVNARPSAGSALAIFRPAGGGWGGPGGGSYGGGNGI
jgi:phage terminase large subunit-like protein